MPDTAGPGEHRGGVATRLDIQVLGEKVVINNLSERQKFPSYGVFGGGAGALGADARQPGRPGERKVGGKESFELAYGETVSFQLSGAGGYGEPFRRDPARVLRDVTLGLVTRVEAAREQYGVVITPAGAVDEEATAALRAGAVDGRPV